MLYVGLHQLANVFKLIALMQPPLDWSYYRVGPGGARLRGHFRVSKRSFSDPRRGVSYDRSKAYVSLDAVCTRGT